MAIFVQFYTYNSNLWLIFILGVPINVALAIWAFVKPKPKKPKSPEALARKAEKKQEKIARKQAKKQEKIAKDNDKK